MLLLPLIDACLDIDKNGGRVGEKTIADQECANAANQDLSVRSKWLYFDIDNLSFVCFILEP